MPGQNDSIVTHEEKRHFLVPNMNTLPPKDSFLTEVSPKEIDALGLDGLELVETHTAREKTGLLQIDVDYAPLYITLALRVLFVLLTPVEPELRPPLDDGSGDVAATTERVVNLNEAITPRLTHEGHVLGGPVRHLKSLSPLSQLSI